MYEEITFELLLGRMLDRALEQDANLDTREGSILYTALAPAAAELKNMYIELDAILAEGFADTADYDFLARRAAERGITPEPATAAVMRGEFNLDIPSGSRFRLGDLTYAAGDRISSGVYRMVCETAGAEGGRQLGDLIPIDYIDGLETAKLTEVLIPGEDEESAEHLRGRYFASLQAQAFGGNAADYREKVGALAGVGGVKVEPAWNGGGTVRLVLIDSDYHVPSEELIASVQAAVDPAGLEGEGAGIAPIGHVVTVAGVSPEEIAIAVSITYQDGWDWEDIKPYAEAAVDDYFAELAKSWADADPPLVVRISQIETRLLNLTGVLDVGGTTLNGAAENIILGSNKIPERGPING